MRHGVPTRLARALCAAFACLPLVAQAQPSGITGLGTLGGEGSAAYGVSADGNVVVGFAQIASLNRTRAFRWTLDTGLVDLGAGGHYESMATGVSADGSVVVGRALNAFRWTAAAGMVDLGSLVQGETGSEAWGVSADGTTVVGRAHNGSADRAFRWTQAGGMADIGTLGGRDSRAWGVSANGAVVVGQSHIAGNTRTHAFRWSNNLMTDLGTLGGEHSYAWGVSGDGNVVTGYAYTPTAVHAFRWTSSGMADLGTLGGSGSYGHGISADGAVVVGTADLPNDGPSRAFRWSQATGMQTVENWLRAHAVSVPVDVTAAALATNSDGSVVVGNLESGVAFVARVSANGNGIITLPEVQASLAAAGGGGAMSLSAATTVLHGAHSQPLARRVAPGQNTFWLAGDWGRDDHGMRNGELGLAEFGFGRHFGPAQFNLSLGQTWARQRLDLSGRVKAEGSYVLAEALVPLSGHLWGTVGAYRHAGDADLRRGYLNAGVPDASSAAPDTRTWGVRARLDWDMAYQVAKVDFSPYVDLSHAVAKLDAYTETGGGFPARFDARKDKATELRVGVNMASPLHNELRLVGTLELARRFEKAGARTSGQVLGLFGFDLAGQAQRRTWMRAGLGFDTRLANGTASLMLNLTSRGEAPSAWLAAGWQTAF